jgi:hypothetical protein
MKQINTLCGQNAEFSVKVKAGIGANVHTEDGRFIEYVKVIN